jgi:hypothetical protein
MVLIFLGGGGAGSGVKPEDFDIQLERPKTSGYADATLRARRTARPSLLIVCGEREMNNVGIILGEDIQSLLCRLTFQIEISDYHLFASNI